ncbi:MAG: hypothetical protein Q4D45_09035 [Lachnospiraceae bacterium]|nr:hypothetical protein [Lachnospiraceae bacterium]
MNSKEYLDTVGNIIQKVSKISITVLTFIFATFIFCQSMFGRVVLNDREHIYFLEESAWKNIGMIVFILFIGAIVKIGIHKKQKVIPMPSDRFLKIVTWVYVICLAIFLIMMQAEPRADQKFVLECATKLLSGDYSPWNIGGYCYQYPHQNGLVLFLTFLFSIFGNGNWLIVQFLNIPALCAIAYFTSKMVELLFEDKKLSRYLYLVLLAFFPMNCYVTFVYGTLFGLCVSMIGIYLVMRFIKQSHIIYGFIGISLVVLGHGFKSNYLIFFVGTMLIILYDMIVRRKRLSALLLCYGVLFYMVFGMLISSAIHHYTGFSANQGIPTKSWITMGLQEGKRGPGWYNGYVVKVFRHNHYDTEKTEEVVEQQLSDRMQELLEDKSYAIAFFAKKTASQWNDGTFEGLWINERRKSVVEWQPHLKMLINDGSITNQKLIQMSHDWLHFLWLGVLFFLILDRKKVDVYQLIFAILFLGGFIFHLFWEAKGQYTLVYAYLLIPYMVRGYQLFFQTISRLADKKDKKWYQCIVQNSSVQLLCAIFATVIFIASTNLTWIDRTLKLSGDEATYQSYIEQKWQEIQ